MFEHERFTFVFVIDGYRFDLAHMLAKLLEKHMRIRNEILRQDELPGNAKRSAEKELGRR